MPHAPAADPYVGHVVGRKYRVEALLGQGGMGRVYRATQLSLEKPVVLKLLHPGLQNDARTVARFHREAKAASRLNHPNSIDVLDFGQLDDGALFIAMEFVDGRDLHRLLTEQWPLPEVRIVRIVGQVLSALADAHAAGVIHRDLKPENVMVVARRGGETDVVKVLDFGIAKIVDAGPEEGPALTRTGFVCGTPEYMSPEQARGGALDARSDLYSVGVLLYQLVTRQLPFSADSAMGYATRHLHEAPRPPNAVRPGACSREMEALILWALRKEPEQRPQTAEAFLEALELLPAASAVHAPRTARVPLPLSLETPAATDAATVSIPSPGPAPRAPTPPAPAPVPRRPPPPVRRRWPLALGLLGVAAVAAALALRPVLFGPPSTTAVVASTASGGPRPWLREVPPERRDARRAAALASDGDDLYLAGDRALARAKWLEAFEADPTPAVALKLGMVAHLRAPESDDEARGFLARALRDAPGSPAAAVVRQWYPDLDASASAR